MRIGMVCPYSFDEPGGVQIHAIELCSELQRRGHTVSLLGPGHRHRAGHSLPDFVELGGGSIPIKYNGSVARLSFGPRTYRRIRSWIRRHNFDIVHIHEPNSPSYSMLTLLACEGPIVATYHTSATNSKILSLALPILRPLLERIHGGIAVSEEARRWQVEKISGDPVLIPNGVDTRIYRAAEPLEELDPNRPRLMFLGRLEEPRKGLDILLDAVPTIVSRVPEVEILIAGGGSIDDLRRRLDERSISYVHHTEAGGVDANQSANVRILGRVSDEDKARALNSSDVYCAPNTGGESFGIVLVEGMAAGAAVLASDLPAFEAVTNNGAAGRLFCNRDARDLADKACALLTDRDARRELIDAASERAEEFDWSTVTSKVEMVYHAVARDGRKVRCS